MCEKHTASLHVSKDDNYYILASLINSMLGFWCFCFVASFAELTAGTVLSVCVIHRLFVYCCCCFFSVASVAELTAGILSVCVIHRVFVVVVVVVAIVAELTAGIAYCQCV